MGAAGLREVCEKSMDGARYLVAALEKTGRMKLKYPSAPYLNEFVMTCDFDVDDFVARCVAGGILPGVKIADGEILIAVTEMNHRSEMDALAGIVENM